MLQRDHPGLRVETEVTVGNPTTVLVDESPRRVAGGAGLPRTGRVYRPAGRLGVHPGRHPRARTPVMVVRGAPRDDPHAPPAPGEGPVVVGVDGSSRSAAAVEFALREAAARDQPLRRGTRLGGAQAQRAGGPPGRGGGHRGAAGRHPQVRVEHRAVEAANAAKALLDVGEEVGASLVVVGSRGRDGFSGLLLGSVSQAVLGHAHRTSPWCTGTPRLTTDATTARRPARGRSAGAAVRSSARRTRCRPAPRSRPARWPAPPATARRSARRPR